jgi:hypothetical protein
VLVAGEVNTISFRKPRLKCFVVCLTKLAQLAFCILDLPDWDFPVMHIQNLNDVPPLNVSREFRLPIAAFLMRVVVLSLNQYNRDYLFQRGEVIIEH